MLVTVIMSTFNKENILIDSVKSILNQTLSNFEFLIMDDFSNDSTYEILAEFEKQDERVKIFRNNQNKGLTKSLNFLIDKSSGNFIARQDDDDVSKPSRLEKQLNSMDELDYKICTTRAFIKGTNKLIPGLSYYLPPKYLIPYKNPFIHGTLVIEKETLLKYKCYNEKFKYAQDYELFIRLINNNEKILNINEGLYELNIENNISKNFKDEQRIYAKLAKKNIKYI